LSFLFLASNNVVAQLIARPRANGPVAPVALNDFADYYVLRCLSAKNVDRRQHLARKHRPSLLLVSEHLLLFRAHLLRLRRQGSTAI
jgi:hypothetical protein